MSTLLDKVDKDLEAIALEVVTLEVGDIRAMGNIINRLSSLEKRSKELADPSFEDLVGALKGYLEKLVLGEADDLKPLEEGLDCLQSIMRALTNQRDFGGDISSVLRQLTAGKAETDATQGASGVRRGDEVVADASGGDRPAQELGEGERQIPGGFVVESP